MRVPQEKHFMTFDFCFKTNVGKPKIIHSNFRETNDSYVEESLAVRENNMSVVNDRKCFHIRVAPDFHFFHLLTIFYTG